MIDSFWVCFDDTDVKCFCGITRKKCPPEKHPLCEKYVVRFVKVEKELPDSISEATSALKQEATSALKQINGMTRDIQKKVEKQFSAMKKSKSELHKTIRKFKV